MKPKQAQVAIKSCLDRQQPLFIWGEPGIGKSSIIKKIAEEENRNLIDLRLSLLDSVDLRGFPFLDNKRMHFATPTFLPTDPNSTDIIFLDEMNKGTPAVQAASYQLVLDRALGEYKLPPKVALIAAGNREDDQADVYTMPAPLSNRFIHIDFEPNFEDWKEWALRNEIRHEVINFLNFRPGLLHDFDPDKRAFPTPRSWEFVNNILGTGIDNTVERQLISGAVGEGASTEFVAFLKIYSTLPNPDSILENPTSAVVPEDLATLYALCGALAQKVTEKTFAALITYSERLRDEFAVLLIRDAIVKNRQLSNTKEFANWAINNSSILT